MEKQFCEFCDEKFGTDLEGRLRKFKEEANELLEAFYEYNKSPSDDTLAHLKDELSDVQAVVSHVGHLLGTYTNDRILEAREKIINRATNPNYKRF